MLAFLDELLNTIPNNEAKLELMIMKKGTPQEQSQGLRQAVVRVPMPIADVMIL